MTVQTQIGVGGDSRCPYEWLARVLTNFAMAEQALGRLCLGLNLPIERGSLSNLADLRRRLRDVSDQRCTALDARIERWCSHRSIRHLLAHATVHCMTDAAGREIVVTRHLPRDKDDVTPDRMWTPEEREEILRKATNDSRSISDQVRNILADSAKVAKLRTA